MDNWEQALSKRRTGLALGYRPDVRDAIGLLSDVWENTTQTLISNCWAKTELLGTKLQVVKNQEAPEGTLRFWKGRHRDEVAEAWVEDNSQEVRACAHSSF